MGTRCNIIVKDKNESIQLYRHWDGYPSAVLADLPDVLTLAWKLPRFEPSDFAAAIVASWKDQAGNIYIDGNKKLHGDIEWLYTIFFDKELKVEIKNIESGLKTVIKFTECAEYAERESEL